MQTADNTDDRYGNNDEATIGYCTVINCCLGGRCDVLIDSEYRKSVSYQFCFVVVCSGGKKARVGMVAQPPQRQCGSW